MAHEHLSQPQQQDAPKGYRGKHAEVKPEAIVSPLTMWVMQNFKGRMGKMMTEIQDPTDRKVVTELREGQELITNDGSKTYVVHSATPKEASEIMREGLKMPAKYEDRSVPNMQWTGVMMAASGERGAVKRNIDVLAYRHAHEAKNIKLVYGFDEPNPGTSAKYDSFEDTFLAHADGTNIRQVENSRNGEPTYIIPPERLVGYFDLQESVFVPYVGETTPQPDGRHNISA